MVSERTTGVNVVETYDDGYVEDSVGYLRRIRCPRGTN